jgi:hypothetical protein
MGPGGVMPEGMTSGMGPPPFATSPPEGDKSDINDLD